MTRQSRIIIRPYTILVALGLIFSVFLHNCTPPKDPVQSVLAYQSELDSVLTHHVVPERESIEAAIWSQSEVDADTIVLSRRLIPIKKVEFLLLTRLDTLDYELNRYKSQQDADRLTSKLKETQQYVDTLLNRYFFN